MTGTNATKDMNAMDINHMVYDEEKTEEPETVICHNYQEEIEVNVVVTLQQYKNYQKRKCFRCESDKHFITQCPFPYKPFGQTQTLPSHCFPGMQTRLPLP